jgi:hypothetical protein
MVYLYTIRLHVYTIHFNGSGCKNKELRITESSRAYGLRATRIQSGSLLMNSFIPLSASSRGKTCNHRMVGAEVGRKGRLFDDLY